MSFKILTYTTFVTHFVTHVWLFWAVCLHMLGESLLHGINLITHRAEKLRCLWCLKSTNTTAYWHQIKCTRWVKIETISTITIKTVFTVVLQGSNTKEKKHVLPSLSFFSWTIKRKYIFNLSNHFVFPFIQRILLVLLTCPCCEPLSGEGHLSCTHLSNHTPHTWRVCCPCD